MPDFRVRVDWFNHGYISEDGATEDALPQNKYPGAPYYTEISTEQDVAPGTSIVLSSHRDLTTVEKTEVNGEMAHVGDWIYGKGGEVSTTGFFIGASGHDGNLGRPSTAIVPNTTYILRYWIKPSETYN